MGPQQIKRYEIWDGAIESVDPELRRESYDIVVTVNALEHVLHLDKALEIANRLTVDAGIFLAHFGPIWSSIKGSHFWVDQNLNFMNPGPVPPFAHLLMTPEELSYFLKRSGIQSDIVTMIVDQHFSSDFINRKFFEDYEDALQKSSWTIDSIQGLWDWECPDYLHHALCRKHGKRNYQSIGIFLQAKKYL